MTKIAICGTAPTSLYLANKFEPDWQIYSCNGAFHNLDRLDLHFELHGMDYLKNEVKPDPSYFQFLKDIGPKAILNKKYDEFPEAQVYPLQEVCDYIGATYFNNTIAYMIAYAMWINRPILDADKDELIPQSLTHLALVGVDMASDSEYRNQRPCCEFYLGIAKGKGIVLHIPDICPLLQSTHLYGFERTPNFVVSSKKQLDDLKLLLTKTEDEKRLADKNFEYTKGMKELLEQTVQRYQ